MGWFGVGSEVKVAGEGVKSALDSVGGLAKSIRTAITGIDPDKQAEIEKIIVEMEAKADAANQALNVIDAQSGSFLQSGWRPVLGWVCVFSIALYYPARILLGMSLWVYYSLQGGKLLILPEVGITDVLGLVATLLGSSVLRTVERKLGVEKN